MSLRCVSGASDKTRAFQSGAVEALTPLRSSEKCSGERRSASTRAWCSVAADIVNEIAGAVNHAAADESLHVDGGGLGRLGPKRTPVAMVNQVTVYVGIGRPGHRRRGPRCHDTGSLLSGC